jgi:mannose-6-phosphate isomerase-like protein (cupin superfamily)
MQTYDVNAIRKKFDALSKRANDTLGAFNDSSLGVGRYVVGKSPWEKHTNGDELLFVMDGFVSIEVLETDGSSSRFRIDEGSLFVVPRGKWHQLTADDNVTIVYASPGEDGVERQREHPAQTPR